MNKDIDKKLTEKVIDKECKEHDDALIIGTVLESNMAKALEAKRESKKASLRNLYNKKTTDYWMRKDG